MKLSQTTLGGISVLEVSEWRDQGLVHGFCGRDLDLRDGASWVRFAAAAALPEQIQLLRQVHGTAVLDAEAIESGAQPLDADGWLSRVHRCSERPVVLGIKTADCFPVILFAPAAGYVGVLHCGWRGTVDGILPQALSRLFALGVKPTDIEIAIGPGAQACCYEVQDDVVALLNHALKMAGESQGDLLLRRSGRNTFADVGRLLEQQALGAGISRERIARSLACTICSTKYFSHRREKALAGRQLSFVCPTLRAKFIS